VAENIEARDGEPRGCPDENAGRKTFAKSLAKFPLTTSMCQRSCDVNAEKA
jgi:hypothetical protein